MLQKWYAPLLVLISGATWLIWQRIEISRLSTIKAGADNQITAPVRSNAQKPPAEIPTGPFPEGPCLPPGTVPTMLCEPSGAPAIVPPMSASNTLDPCRRNDDGSAGPIPLQFSFDFYGTTYTEDGITQYLNNQTSHTVHELVRFF